MNFQFLKQIFKMCVLFFVSVFFSGCSGALPPKQESQNLKSPLTLPDSVIEANIGNIEGLYKSWIIPFTKQSRYIPNERSSVNEPSKSELAIKEGFTRFCIASGGTSTQKQPDVYNTTYNCSKNDSVFIGEFTVHKNRKTEVLTVTFEYPKQAELQNAREKAFGNLKALNGPTGWVVTDEGKFRFIRFGTFLERDLVEIKLIENGSYEYIPIENVSEIKFLGCCDFYATLQDGRKKTIRSVYLVDRTEPDRTISFDKYGLRLVVLDQISGLPHTRLFPDLDAIESIQIDKDKAAWQNKPVDLIKSTQSLDKYINQLRVEANSLYTESTKNGWIKMLPGGNKLTPQLMEYLQSKLRELSTQPVCMYSTKEGLEEGLEIVLRCRVAAREANIIVNKGYSLLTDVTPLSSIIVLNKIKRDMR